MKKCKKLFISITALLCLFFVVFGFKTTARAATGVLVNGADFNKKLKEFNSSKVGVFDSDKVIKKIIFAKTSSVSVASMKKKTVGNGVTAYYDLNSQTVYVCSSGKIKFNSDCHDMFYKLNALESIDFGKGIIDTTNMKTTSDMFRECSKLKVLDMREFKTPNLTSMSGMFHVCTSLESLDLSSFDTSKVTSMHSTFMTVTKLKKLDLSNFNTSKVTDMTQMFGYDDGLESLDLSNFNTSNVTDMYRMFNGCSGLKTLNLGKNFKTSKVTRMMEMFSGCRSLEYLNLSTFDLSKLDYKTSGGFIGYCYGLQYIDAPAVIPKNFDYDAETNWSRADTLGNIALDADKNGVADNDKTYGYFPAAKTSKRYLVLDGIERAKKKKEQEEKNKPGNTDEGGQEGNQSENQSGNQSENQSGSQSEKKGDRVDSSTATSKLPMKVTVDGITYNVGVDGQAEVLKIGAVKKKKIDSLTVDGVTYPVVRIANNACKSNKRIKEVTLGKNISHIGKNAFYKCKKLTKITINANKSLVVKKGAFKKLPAKAVIKVKGVKGKKKKKIVKAIEKQTNAIVK